MGARVWGRYTTRVTQARPLSPTSPKSHPCNGALQKLCPPLAVNCSHLILKVQNRVWMVRVGAGGLNAPQTSPLHHSPRDKVLQGCKVIGGLQGFGPHGVGEVLDSPAGVTGVHAHTLGALGAVHELMGLEEGLGSPRGSPSCL